MCCNCEEQGHIAKNRLHPKRDGTPKPKPAPEVNSIGIAPDNQVEEKQRRVFKIKLYDQKRDGSRYNSFVTGKIILPITTVPNIPAIGLETTTVETQPEPKPMFATLEINGLKSKVID